MTEYLSDPSVIVALIGIVIASVSLLGTLVVAFVSVKNTQVQASDEIAKAATEMVSSYRIDLLTVNTRLADVTLEVKEWEKRYKELDQKWEQKYNELSREYDEAISRVRYLEDRLDTGPFKEKR